MDLSKLVIQRVDNERFLDLEQSYTSAVLGHKKGYQPGEIITPMGYADYPELIYAFAGHDLAYGISFNNQGEIEEYELPDITERVIRHIESVSNSTWQKVGVLELVFKKKPTYKTSARIRVADLGNLVVAYEVNIPPQWSDVFTIKKIPRFDRNKFIYALWDFKPLSSVHRSELLKYTGISA